MSFDLDPNSPVKIASEAETRKKLLLDAKRKGYEPELLKLFNKYDNLLRNCSNQKERQDIGKLGAYEIFVLLDKGGDLYVDGELVYKEDSHDDDLKITGFFPGNS